jgi:hypothetical protein
MRINFRDFPPMTVDEKTRLHDLRLRHGLGTEIEPFEYQEMLNLQAKEHLELHDSVAQADPQFVAIGAGQNPSNPARA